MGAEKKAMPQYVFFCPDCHKDFTQHLIISEFEKGGITCPNCGGKRVKLHVEEFAAVTSKKS